MQQENHRKKTETPFVAGYFSGCLAGYLTFIFPFGAIDAPPPQRFTLADGHLGAFAFLLPFATVFVSIAVLPSRLLVRFLVGRTAFNTLLNACGFGVVCAMLSVPLLTWIGNYMDFERRQPCLPLLRSALAQSPAYISAGLAAGCVNWITEFVIPLRAARGRNS